MKRSHIIAGRCAGVLLSGVLVTALVAVAYAQHHSSEAESPTPSDATAAGASEEAQNSSPPQDEVSRDEVSRDEVLDEIEKKGKTPPEWWGSLKLKYPPRLNLKWEKVTKEWNSNVNLDQHLWSYIDRNHTRGRYGAKLLTHTLTINKDDPERLAKSMYKLGHVYANILEDWARAAFWLQKADGMGGTIPRQFKTTLAECYWRLGSREMAREVLSRQRKFDASTVRLWLHTGDGDKALKLAGIMLRVRKDVGYFLTGDIYRYNGWFKEAKDNYRKALMLKAKRGDKRRRDQYKRTKGYVRINLETVQAVEDIDMSRIPDGVYRAGCKGYVGIVSVDVAVKGGRIESVTVIEEQDEDKRENRALSALVATPRRIVESQAVTGVDTVTGATVTADAISNAVAKALAKASKGSAGPREESLAQGTSAKRRR